MGSCGGLASDWLSPQWRHPVRRNRSLVVATVAVLLATTAEALPSGVGASENLAPPFTDAASAGDTNSAVAIARTYGHPVEDLSQASATTTVLAQPDGSFHLTETTIPTRVRRGTGWVPVDLRLQPTAEGGLAPISTPTNVTFSAGGDTRLAAIEAPDGSWVAQSWPTNLPAAEVSGASAAYRNVFPGVDLVLTATEEGFSQVLVVRSARAAANPSLRKVSLGVTSQVNRTAKASGGGMDLVSKFGTGVHVGTASWWDSSWPDASTDGPGGPGIEREAPAMYSAHAITLDAGAITARGHLTYPLYIDPSYGWTGQIADSKTAYTFVDKAYPNTGYWDGSHPDHYQHVGYIDASHSYDVTHTTRSFWRMSTSAMGGKHILSAAFNTFEVWSASCNARVVDLFTTGGISSSTTWSNQPSWASSRTSYANVAYGWSSGGIGGSSSCSTGGHAVGFNVLGPMASAAKAKSSTITLGLRADNETDWLGWKKFKAAATLDVSYNSYPSTPTNLTNSSNTVCATGSSRPTIGDLTPTLKAVGKDPDGGNVRMLFEWWSTGGSKVGSALTAALASGSTFSATVPSGAFSSGQNMSWRARTYDGTDYSLSYSSWCELHLDATAPKAPAVASTDFPTNPTTTPLTAGSSGSITLTNGGSTDVTAYYISVNGRPYVKYTPSSNGGSITTTITPGLPSSWVDAYSVDAANNKSGTTHYAFPLTPSSTLRASWNIVGPESIDANGQIPATSSTANALTLQENSAITSSTSQGTTIYDTNDGPTVDQDDLGNFQLDVDGVNDYATSASNVVDTTNSYTVVANVRPGVLKRGTYQTAVTEWGSVDSAFYLQYDPNGNIRFGVTNSDSTTRTATLASASTATILANCGSALQNTDPTADNYYDENGWHTAIGVYDRPDNQIQLWIDDCPDPVAQVDAPTTWNAMGPVGIGTAQQAGAPSGANMYGGGIQDVLIYSGIPTSDQVLAQIGAAHV